MAFNAINFHGERHSYVRAKSMNFTVMFTSAGRRVELVRAFRRAFSSLRIQGRIIAIDTDPLAPALRCADRGVVVPCVSSSGYVQAVVDLCRTEHVNVIFPLIDPDIPVLAENRLVIEETGAQVAVVSPESAGIVRDKWRTCEFFENIGLKTPRSWLPEDLDENELRYPLFIKPRKGSGGANCFRIETLDELRFFCRYVPDALIQEFIRGSEITTDVACTLDSEVVAVVSRKRIEVRGGEVSKGVTIKNLSLQKACVRIARALPARGPITVQCIMKDGIPYFTEINARFGGGVPLGIAAGADSPRWLLARIAGIPDLIPPLGTYTEGLYCSRYDDSFFLTESDHEALESSRLRS